ncbi:MAG: hypothetical protein ACQKBW_12370 [Puniceicoccales bacterium]
MSIDNELKRIEKAEQNLAKQKKKLIDQQKKDKAAQAKLETLVKQSGFATPKELVEALIEKYNLRLHRRRTTTGSTPTGRRKRTKITPELRDEVKTKLKSESMNKVSKDMQISYAVIAKIAKGAYDKIK